MLTGSVVTTVKNSISRFSRPLCVSWSSCLIIRAVFLGAVLGSIAGPLLSFCTISHKLVSPLVDSKFPAFVGGLLNRLASAFAEGPDADFTQIKIFCTASSVLAALSVFCVKQILSILIRPTSHVQRYSFPSLESPDTVSALLQSPSSTKQNIVLIYGKYLVWHTLAGVLIFSGSFMAFLYAMFIAKLNIDPTKSIAVLGFLSSSIQVQLAIIWLLRVAVAFIGIDMLFVLWPLIKFSRSIVMFDHSKVQSNCAICLGSLNDGQAVFYPHLKQSHNHVMHLSCFLDSWMSNRCPGCGVDMQVSGDQFVESVFTGMFRVCLAATFSCVLAFRRLRPAKCFNTTDAALITSVV